MSVRVYCVCMCVCVLNTHTCIRSGAVEQLKVHARCLEVDVYDKGYHKDPAAVARDAIKDATAVSKQDTHTQRTPTINT